MNVTSVLPSSRMQLRSDVGPQAQLDSGIFWKLRWLWQIWMVTSRYSCVRCRATGGRPAGIPYHWSRPRGSSGGVLPRLGVTGLVRSYPALEPWTFDRAALVALGRSHQRAYQEARPYPHVVIDGLLGDARSAALAAAFPAASHPGWKRRDLRRAGGPARAAAADRVRRRRPGAALAARRADPDGVPRLPRHARRPSRPDRGSALHRRGPARDAARRPPRAARRLQPRQHAPPRRA